MADHETEDESQERGSKVKAKFKFEKFKVKDIAFLAIMAVVLLLCSSLAVPLMFISLFGLQNMGTAIFFGIFITIALMKVRKPGALSILGIFSAVPLAIMQVSVFLTNSIAAVLAECITLLIFRNYQNDKAIMLGAGLVMPISLPFTLVFGMLINGKTLAQALSGEGLPVWLVVLTCMGTVVLSFAGTLIGHKIGKELQKAGKLK